MHPTTRAGQGSNDASPLGPAQPDHSNRPAAPDQHGQHGQPAASTPAYPPRLPEYAIYKPNARGTGGVLRFSLSPFKGALFVNAANQCGDKQFDWERRLVMKWTLPDIGAVLAVLQKRQPNAKLFHQTDIATSAFELTSRNEPDRAPFLVVISRQSQPDKELRKVVIPLSHAEAAVLQVALQTATTRILGW